MSDYLADVLPYDAGANAGIVETLVKHWGIALRSRDASLVSCSDKFERGCVAEKWCGKTLGITGDAADNVVEPVCQQMKGDRHKSRVTFYYWVAKELDKLGDL